jgi:hypothetical protein
MRKFTKSMMVLALLMTGWSSAYAQDEIDVTTLPWVNNGQGCTQDFNNDNGSTVFGTDVTGASSYVDVSAYGTIKLYGKASQRARLFINRAEAAGDNGIFFVDLDEGGVGVFDCNDVLTKQPKAQHIYLNGVKASAWDTHLNLSQITVSGSPITFPVLDPFDPSKNHMLVFNNGTAGSNPWERQATYTLPTPLASGKTYVFEAIINAVNGGETRLVPNVNGASSQYLTTKGLWTNEFTRYQVEFTATANHTKLEIDLGPCGGEVYFDNVSLKEKGESTNLIANGDFETEGTTGWGGVNNTFEQVENELGEVKEPGILVTVGEAGWVTFRTGSNVKIPDGSSVKAYAAKYMAEGNYVKLTEVTEFTSWQSVLIEAPEGKHMLESPASATAIDASINDLQANDGTPKAGDGTYYGLAKKSGVVGFYKVATTSEVPAWKIYLKIPAASAPEFLPFEGNTTGIEAVKAVEAKGEFFNLAGQRVAQPTKGLYIVNGKKVIFK